MCTWYIVFPICTKNVCSTFIVGLFVYLYSLTVVGGSVVINDARISANVLFVTWSTNVSDIEKFAVAINETRSGVIIINELVSKDKRNYSLPVEPASNYYEIIITASDHCGQHFTSKMLVVNEDGTADRPFSLQPTATLLHSTMADSAGYCTCSCPSPMPTTMCDDNSARKRSW